MSVVHPGGTWLSDCNLGAALRRLREEYASEPSKLLESVAKRRLMNKQLARSKLVDVVRAAKNALAASAAAPVHSPEAELTVQNDENLKQPLRTSTFRCSTGRSSRPNICNSKRKPLSVLSLARLRG